MYLTHRYDLTYNALTQYPTHLHGGVEDLEDVVLKSDGGQGAVGQNGHGPLVQQREKGLHGVDVLHTVLRLLEPGGGSGRG